jgi:hypothetical protein
VIIIKNPKNQTQNQIEGSINFLLIKIIINNNNKTRGVSQYGLVIYNNKYLKAKEEL